MPKVKISYGVELEDIPEEVQKLFDGITVWMDTLSKQSDTIDDLLETEELESCVSVMDKMRRTLATMDARILDLANILQGYNNYMKQVGEQNEPSERRSTVDTSSNNVVQRPEQSDGGEVE